MHIEDLYTLRIPEEDITPDVQIIMLRPCIRDAAERSSSALFEDSLSRPDGPEERFSDYEQAKKIFLAFYAKWVQNALRNFGYYPDDRIYTALMISFRFLIAPIIFYMADSHL